MRLTFGLFGMALVAIVPVGCGKWEPAKTYVAPTNTDAGTAYAKVLKVLAERGYHIVEQRDADHYVQVRAHIDENFVDRQSFIAAQVDPAGGLKLTPSGHLVRGDKVHKKLATELSDIEDAVRGDLASASPAAVGPTPEAAPATSAPAPPADTAATPYPAVPVATNAVAPAKHAPTTPSKTTATSTPTPAPTPAPKAKAKSDDDWVSVP